MVIIIDGYNFIFTVPELDRHVGVNRIESVRDYVIALFSKYKEKKLYDIIVVFDGNHTDLVLPRKLSNSGVTVIYSKSGIDADSEIKRIASMYQNPREVCIVTYDNDIKRYAKKNGCHIIDPREMYSEILKVINKERKTPTVEPEAKQMGPTEQDIRYWKEIFQDIPDKELNSTSEEPEIPAGKQRKTQPGRSIMNEPLSKYRGPSSDETNYWINIFKDLEEDDRVD